MQTAEQVFFYPQYLPPKIALDPAQPMTSSVIGCIPIGYTV